MDYREWLKREIERRCARNAAYSLRAFARDLQLSPSHLSGILGGRYGLSRKNALEIAHRIGLSPREKELFVESVESQHARSLHARKQALKKLRALRSKKVPGKNLRLDAFQLISDWYHFAILEVSYLKNFQARVPWIARVLGISTLQARTSVERLFRLGLLKETRGTWTPSDENTITGFDIPSEAIRNFHSQILEKAGQALHTQPVDRRDFRSTILAIRRNRLAEAKKAIEKLHQEFSTELSEDGAGNRGKDEVYCLSTQFFSLTESSRQENPSV